MKLIKREFLSTIQGFLVFGISLFFLTGCGKQIEDFVREGVKNPISVVAPSTSTASTKDINVSNGAAKVYGFQVEGQVRVGISNRTLSGNQVEAKVSVNRTRVE